MQNKRMTENVHKIAYLVEQYPEKNLEGIIEMLVMPAIEINTGLWLAQDLGILSAPDPETGLMTVLKAPKAWEFGKAVTELQEMILYAYGKMNANETDQEEFDYSAWCMGYAAHDALIAMKQLLEQKKMAQYEVVDGENTYTFYTLYENGEQEWGRKQFKTEPTEEIEGEIVEGSDEPETE